MTLNTPKIRPLGDRLVVEPKVRETKTASGIVIPDTATEEKPIEGTVIAVGDGKWHDGKKHPLQVEVGARILFGKYAGTAIKLDKEYLIMREDDVMGVLE